jgi:Asp-tRNA(Asn)/Glu-tRNA(Gln) amidotransferase B subunit
MRREVYCLTGKTMGSTDYIDPIGKSGYLELDDDRFKHRKTIRIDTIQLEEVRFKERGIAP